MFNFAANFYNGSHLTFDSNNTLSLSLALFLHLDMSSGGAADSIDIATTASYNSTDSIERYRHFLMSERRVQVLPHDFLPAFFSLAGLLLARDLHTWGEKIVLLIVVLQISKTWKF